ncbi:DNA uptake protein ComE-like DNA-binding protein [Chryseobacterium sp. H1D6B]|uniref:helix-hairpin-helix domain-containing protein n=1 Tax=Chryseobacterium sp. H1D6B TaxID=2940588 RepID=UPI0018277A66|nr:helix-hairpin-helix domain-containing protein [Chryseobacterium sp. H1D6B]MDH6253096.1 DNA uptake protein ComE-like DNA-binding protein [Chryseobacterium sp. H1D6B]
MMRKRYYQKAAFLGILLIMLYAFQKYTSLEHKNFPGVKFISKGTLPLHLSEFDPNDLDAEQWQQYGFSEKQAIGILNYKNLLGGKFTSKEQFKKCYSVSSVKFASLEPYILLPETNKDAGSSNFKKKSITISKKFNPDHFSAVDWTALGFSENQTEAILKYKKYLGGSFISKERFKQCFIISPENYQKLAPYLLLPEKTPENLKGYAKNYAAVEMKHQSFDPNILDINGWAALGFSQNQARVIVSYRDRNLKGSFKTLEDIQKCFVISDEKFEEIKPYIILNASVIARNTDGKKPEIKQEKTDFSKIDLNSITFKQLLEFGLDERSAGSMIGFRKKLGGFVNKQQILETYNIDKDLVQKLISTCPLNSSNVAKYTLIDAPEEWLKNHPYFKYSADKIIFYRTSNPDDKKIWKLIKVKPEYEARMKLYLK